MAKNYLAEIYKIQPEGPYSLLGWSFGCHLAHEIATLLQKDNKAVNVLIFMDGYPLWKTYRDMVRTDRESLRAMFEAFTGSAPENEQQLSVAGLKKQLSEIEHPLASLDQNIFERILAEFRDAPNLLSEFSPSRFQGDLIFFRALQGHSEADNVNYDPHLWGEYVEGSITLHDINCSHDSMLSEGPLKEIGPILQQLFGILTGIRVE